MKKLFSLLLLSISFSAYSFQNEWQDIWVNGLELLENQQYIEAKEVFNKALKSMSDNDIKQNPEVLLKLAQLDNLLENYDNVLDQANKLVTIFHLSDEQRLLCGNLLVTALWKKGLNEEAVEAYSKYIANSPIRPKCHFKEDVLIIYNIPSNDAFKKCGRSFFTKEFCETNENLHEYGDVWAIDIKKCRIYTTTLNSTDSQRSEAIIRSCCNTCSTLATAATIACSRFPNAACAAGCVLFVEALRQIGVECCYNGGVDGKCWEKFSFWKSDFHQKNPRCPHPDML